MKREHRSTRMDTRLIKQLSDLAESQHRSFSNMLEVILNDYFKGQKEKGKAA